MARGERTIPVPRKISWLSLDTADGPSADARTMNALPSITRGFKPLLGMCPTTVMVSRLAANRDSSALKKQIHHTYSSSGTMYNY